MRGFILFLMALTGLFLLANTMVSDSGYVLIAYNSATFESTFWGFILLTAGIAGIVWLTVIVLRAVFGITSFFYPMTIKAKECKAHKFTNKGLIEFTQGRWKAAEKLLTKGAKGSSPLINYLGAARAAHEYGNLEASAEYLRKADHKEPGAELAIGITQAQLQLASGQLEGALATLTKLHKKLPRHTYVMKLLKEVYCRLNDWRSLAALLPRLKKEKVVDDEKYRHLELQCFSALFKQAYNQGKGFDQPDQKLSSAYQIWSGLSSSQKRDPAMVYRYGHCLAQLGAEQKSESFLREHLGKFYSTEMILLYGRLCGNDLGRQLRFAETLLNSRPNDAELLLTLGRLSLRNELWGKAKEYFEASLRHKKMVDTYNELGRLLAHLGDHEASSRYFQQGLHLAADSIVDLPMPETIKKQP